MFKLSEKYEINRNILRCDYIRYSSSGTSTKDTPKSQINIDIPREVCVISLLNSYIELSFDVIHAAANNRYADNFDIRLVNLGPVTLFSNHKLTTSSGKHIEEVNHAQIMSSMYKCLLSARGCDDLSIFAHGRIRGQRQLTNNKTQKGKFHLRIYLRDFFGIADYQQKGT